MPKYFILGNWTNNGEKTVKETVERADAVKSIAAKLGAKLDIYSTTGQYDFIAIAEVANDEAYTRLASQIGAQGHTVTTTLKTATRAGPKFRPDAVARKA